MEKQFLTRIHTCALHSSRYHYRYVLDTCQELRMRYSVLLAHRIPSYFQLGLSWILKLGCEAVVSLTDAAIFQENHIPGQKVYQKVAFSPSASNQLSWACVGRNSYGLTQVIPILSMCALPGCHNLQCVNLPPLSTVRDHRVC